MLPSFLTVIGCPVMLVGTGLISQDVVENLMSWQHSGFSVHGEVQVPDRDAAARWDVYELIARVLDHLPPPRQQLVRYWGYYSNVSRGKRRAAARRLAATDDEPFRRRARLTWAALIKRVYEVDPLLCPFCGAEMKIIAFITEHPTVCHILQHIQMPAQRPEPLTPCSDQRLLVAANSCSARDVAGLCRSVPALRVPARGSQPTPHVVADKASSYSLFVYSLTARTSGRAVTTKRSRTCSSLW